MTNAGRPRKSASRLSRRRQRARAARQALCLCEAARPQGPARFQGGQHSATTVTTRAALRAAGVPPHLAAELRRRLRLIPEQETER